MFTDLLENRDARNPVFLNERVRGTDGLSTSFGEETMEGDWRYLTPGLYSLASLFGEGLWL